MKLIEKLIKRLEKDYEEVVKEFNKLKKTDIMERAYELAHYNEIVDTICDCTDIEYPPFDNATCKKALAHKNNLLKVVYRSWLDYNHPESYNFFSYECLVDICSYAFNNN